MTELDTSPNLPAPDDFYAQLLQAQEGLTPEQGAGFALRLALILANHIGDEQVLAQALDLARATGEHPRNGGDT